MHREIQYAERTLSWQQLILKPNWMHINPFGPPVEHVVKISAYVTHSASNHVDRPPTTP